LGHSVYFLHHFSILQYFSPTFKSIADEGDKLLVFLIAKVH